MKTLLLSVATIFTLVFSIAAADEVTVTEYVLPVSPTNLLVDPNGDVWFSSFEDNAIGKLETETGQISLYTRQRPENVWGLKRDPQGNLWFSTVNGESIGKFDPSTGIFFEWDVPCQPFGLELDPATGNVWFAAAGDVPGIYRISPSSNWGAYWSIFPFANAYDLDLAPSGDVWFTVQPGGNQGVGRLDPVKGQMIVWTMPITDSRPFRLFAEAENSIWLTELGTAANAIAQFLPFTNTLREFRVPTPASNPWSLQKAGSMLWFTERATNSVGRLDPELVSPIITILTPIVIDFDTVEGAIMPSSYTVSPQVSSASILTSAVTQTETDGFLELRLSTANSQPTGIALDAVQNTLWFAGSAVNRIGRLEFGEPMNPVLFLPLISRSE